jgi:hypothetical protein
MILVNLLPFKPFEFWKKKEVTWVQNDEYRKCGMTVILFVEIHAHTKQSEQVQDTDLATI